MKGIIVIDKPILRGCRVEWPLVIDGKQDSFVTCVSENIIEYITTDRIDSVIAGLMIFAVRNGYDFKSTMPISDEFLYNLNRHLLPAICKTSHFPKIDAPVTPSSSQRGDIVATGISCGVDSLYTIATHTHLPYADGNITHLAFFDAGSHHSDKGPSKTKEGRRENAKAFALKNGFGYLEVSTTLPELLDRHTQGGYSHVESHTFLMLHCVLTIANGISKYYYGSGHEYNDFNCNYRATGNYDASLYDLLTLTAASHGGIRFYSAGGDASRLEKVKKLTEYMPAYDALNVCISEVDNCGKCFKCKRTMLELDALGVLDRFSEVFDVDYYRRHKVEYLRHAYIEALKGDVFMKEILPFFKRDMSVIFKIKAIIKKCMSVIRNRI